MGRLLSAHLTKLIITASQNSSGKRYFIREGIFDHSKKKKRHGSKQRRSHARAEGLALKIEEER